MDLKLDGNGDLAIENNDLVLISGLDAIAQDCRIKLKFFKGEWFLDTRIGVPYFQSILGKKSNTVSAILRKAILEVPGILSITSFEPTYDSIERELRVSFRADTTEGPLDFSEAFII